MVAGDTYVRHPPSLELLDHNLGMSTYCSQPPSIAVPGTLPSNRSKKPKMGSNSEIHLPFYKPEKVTAFLGLGSNSFIGTIDHTTVLKYPKHPGDKEALAILHLEAQMFLTIGPHEHNIGFKALREDGL